VKHAMSKSKSKTELSGDSNSTKHTDASSLHCLDHHQTEHKAHWAIPGPPMDSWEAKGLRITSFG